ncbi:MAG: hypothetical protein ACRYGR_09230 [Janthinobacterium lividum]
MSKVNFKYKLLLSTVIAFCYSGNIMASSNEKDDNLSNNMTSSFNHFEEDADDMHNDILYGRILDDREDSESDSNEPGFGMRIVNGALTGAHAMLKMIPEDTVKLVIKETSKAVGAPVIGDAYSYASKMSRPGDDEKNEGTIARLIGDKVKSTLSSSSALGEYTTEALKQVNASGYNSVTENFLINCTAGLGRIKIDADADASDIAGQMAQGAVKRIPLIGGLVAIAN